MRVCLTEKSPAYFSFIFLNEFEPDKIGSIQVVVPVC